MKLNLTVYSSEYIVPLIGHAEILNVNKFCLTCSPIGITDEIRTMSKPVLLYMGVKLGL
jgi:hypothetical protein